MKKILIGILVCLTLTGCGSNQKNLLKREGWDYTVSGLKRASEYEDLELFVTYCLKHKKTEEVVNILKWKIDQVDIVVEENKEKIKEKDLEYFEAYRECCVELLNAEYDIEIDGALAILRAREFEIFDLEKEEKKAELNLLLEEYKNKNLEVCNDYINDNIEKEEFDNHFKVQSENIDKFFYKAEYEVNEDERTAYYGYQHYCDSIVNVPKTWILGRVEEMDSWFDEYIK